MPQTPNQYWSNSPERRSQRLYVGFCEFASAVLDFAEGTEIIHDRKASGLRLNWAATILYYSLVHSSRFLIFIPFGDFPTRHDLLSDCFDPGNIRPVGTTWLRDFAAAGLANREAIDPERVSYDRTYSFWEQYGEQARVGGVLTWLGRTLAAAKKLRNENNCEALLIAHEYRHERLTSVFRDLATAMEIAARRALAEIAALWGVSLSDEMQREFVGCYLEGRILRPVQSWYSRKIEKEVRSITNPLKCAAGDSVNIARIEDDIDLAVFNPKRSLMSQFAQKVEGLQEVSQDDFTQGRYTRQGNAREAPFAQQRLHFPPVEPTRTILDQKAGSKPVASRKRPSDVSAAETQAQLRQARESMVEKVRQMDPIARLHFIADDTHVIEFYPPEFGDVSEETLRSLPEPVRSRLWEKSGRLKKGQWKAFARRLAGL